LNHVNAGSRSDAARIGGVGLQIVRDWVLRFTAEGSGLLNGKAPGVPSILDDNQRRALRQIGEDGPIPAVHGVVRWRLIDLAQRAFEEFRVSICASSRHARVTMRKTRRPLRLKKILGDRGGDSHKSGSWQADRDLVPDAMKAASLHCEGSESKTAEPPHMQIQSTINRMRNSPLCIEPIGFGAPGASVHQDTRWLRHMADHTMFRKKPMQP
jgi:transposase